ncbi:hypothetical protein ABZZ20_16195 [Streptomyces sp. NPDC006430]|uniref:hypothetical protein n=1 Tax=Streptomyces sp. NPDC006430 TaxID=3154299 RepID=UPI0033AFD54A
MAVVDSTERTVPADNGEANLLVARQVEPGHEETFEAWAHGILERTAAFAVVFSTLTTYLAMPAVSRLLRPWLAKAGQG